jgi:hypothetical protein
MKDKVHQTCQSFLSDWDRTDWLIEHGDWAEGGKYIAEGTIDPDNVENRSRCLRVGFDWQGWDCREGWAA